MGVALREILVDFRSDAAWQELQGIAAVDAHNALYQFLSIIRQPDGTPLMDGQGRITSHLSGILFRTLNFIEKGIKPVYIFDGEPPEFKREEIEERREQRRQAEAGWQEAQERGDTEEAYKYARSASRVDSYIVSSSMELLRLMGIPWVQAPSEGEAQAAYMARRGDAKYAVSQDYDALLFGAPVLARNLTISGKRRFRGRVVTLNPERIVLADVLKGLDLTREELVEIGILVGTDFNQGVRGVGAKTALKIVKKGEFRERMRESDPDFDPETVKSFFLSPPVTDDYALAWPAPDTRGIVQFLCGDFGFSEERVNSALEKLQTKTGQKTLDQWF
ncbi:MAG: flap endonuclease-1 [Methanomicrobiales archaeon]|nr:flap endonuclease-1 [Methanomicrobiales archaeon]